MKYGPVRFYIIDTSRAVPRIVEGPFATEDKAFAQTLKSGTKLEVMRCALMIRR